MRLVASLYFTRSEFFFTYTKVTVHSTCIAGGLFMHIKRPQSLSTLRPKILVILDNRFYLREDNCDYSNIWNYSHSLTKSVSGIQKCEFRSVFCPFRPDFLRFSPCSQWPQGCCSRFDLAICPHTTRLLVCISDLE